MLCDLSRVLMEFYVLCIETRSSLIFLCEIQTHFYESVALLTLILKGKKILMDSYVKEGYREKYS